MSEDAPAPLITLSVVSHGQNALVNALCEDVERVGCAGLSLILTENIRDANPLTSRRASGRVEIVANAQPKGFGANHNAAFRRCGTPYFCVCNPDIRLPADPFPALLAALAAPSNAAAGPLVRSPNGRVEDSARRFPTLATLLRKLVREADGPDYPVDRGPVAVDWVAGMFMLFRSERFRAVGGFDERYFLYYEDVDLCRRLQAAGHDIVFQPRAEVIHDARRGSRRDPFLMRHHAASALRFFLGAARRD
ncbi:MAG: glycosyltransferase family 2 protein [Betaproteobacteria bacterium]|nr:MAG: glycosyltransferase family 2 protein [Betaproteobacteria bacterium]